MRTMNLLDKRYIGAALLISLREEILSDGSSAYSIRLEDAGDGVVEMDLTAITLIGAIKAFDAIRASLANAAAA